MQSAARDRDKRAHVAIIAVQCVHVSEAEKRSGFSMLGIYGISMNS